MADAWKELRLFLHDVRTVITISHSTCLAHFPTLRLSRVALHFHFMLTSSELSIGIEGPARLERMFGSIIVALLVVPTVLSSPLDLPNSVHPNISEYLNLSSPSLSASRIVEANTPDHSDNITCFYQDGIDTPLVPTNVIDCIDATWKIVRIGIFGKDFNFHRTHSRPFPLPNSFTVRSCTIWLDMTSEDGEARFDPREIESAIIAILTKCVSHPPMLGGKSFVGPERAMELLVFGNRWQGAGDS